jgi:hypothetical protein
MSATDPIRSFAAERREFGLCCEAVDGIQAPQLIRGASAPGRLQSFPTAARRSPPSRHSGGTRPLPNIRQRPGNDETGLSGAIAIAGEISVGACRRVEAKSGQRAATDTN